jgi:addiction module HigA family antidote
MFFLIDCGVMPLAALYATCFSWRRLVSAMARFIDVPPPRINEFVLRKRAVTPDTDLRLARNYGMSEVLFLRLQVDYDERMQKRAVVGNLKAIMPRTA